VSEQSTKPTIVDRICAADCARRSSGPHVAPAKSIMMAPDLYEDACREVPPQYVKVEGLRLKAILGMAVVVHPLLPAGEFKLGDDPHLLADG
jgi:hypothetical protein